MKRILTLISSMTLLGSCAPSGEGGSSGAAWFLLLFLFIPLGILGLLIYRYWVDPEDIVWTSEDIEEYNRKKAEEAGEEYVGQRYVPEIETPEPKKRYQVIWAKAKNYFKDRKMMKELEIARENSIDSRIREGVDEMREIGIIVDAPVTSPVPTATALLPSGNNHNSEEDIDLDGIDIDDIDIDALLKD